jgi:hypothetical protein
LEQRVRPGRLDDPLCVAVDPGEKPDPDAEVVGPDPETVRHPLLQRFTVVVERGNRTFPV